MGEVLRFDTDDNGVNDLEIKLLDIDRTTDTASISMRTLMNDIEADEDDTGTEPTSNETPGFELSLIIIALFISLILYKKRQ